MNTTDLSTFSSRMSIFLSLFEVLVELDTLRYIRPHGSFQFQLLLRPPGPRRMFYVDGGHLQCALPFLFFPVCSINEKKCCVHLRSIFQPTKPTQTKLLQRESQSYHVETALFHNWAYTIPCHCCILLLILPQLIQFRTNMGKSSLHAFN